MTGLIGKTLIIIKLKTMKTLKITMASLSILASMFMFYMFAYTANKADLLLSLITFIMSMTTAVIGTYLFKTK